jgi:hypothetical protein
MLRVVRSLLDSEALGPQVLGHLATTYFARIAQGCSAVIVGTVYSRRRSSATFVVLALLIRARAWLTTWVTGLALAPWVTGFGMAPECYPICPVYGPCPGSQ